MSCCAVVIVMVIVHAVEPVFFSLTGGLKQSMGRTVVREGGDTQQDGRTRTQPHARTRRSARAPPPGQRHEGKRRPWKPRTEKGKVRTTCQQSGLSGPSSKVTAVGQVKFMTNWTGLQTLPNRSTNVCDHCISFAPPHGAPASGCSELLCSDVITPRRCAYTYIVICRPCDNTRHTTASSSSLLDLVITSEPPQVNAQEGRCVSDSSVIRDLWTQCCLFAFGRHPTGP